MTLSFAAGAGIVGAAVVVAFALTVAVRAKRRSETSAPSVRSGAGLDDYSFKLRKGTCRTPASRLEKVPMSPPPVGLHCDGSASV